MSFGAGRRVIDLPRLAHPGLVLGGQDRAGGREEEDVDVDSGPAAADERTALSQETEDELARLRQRLREALASEPPL